MQLRGSLRAGAATGCSRHSYSAFEETGYVWIMAGTTRERVRQSYGPSLARRAGKPVMRIPAFWDSSVLVPLCVRQDITQRALGLYKAYDVAVLWATPVEIASALARLVRMRQLDSSDWTQSRRLAKRLADSWWVIQPSETLRAKSIQLVNRYDLLAADSFQLAAALEWCEDAPQERVFLTTDQKLRGAALLSGFDARKMW